MLQKFRISQEPFCFASDRQLLMWKQCNKVNVATPERVHVAVSLLEG